MRSARLTVVCLAVCSMLSFAGCVPLLVGAAAAGAGAGTYAYVKGELQATYDAGYEKTWSTTLAALDAMEMRTSSASKDAIGGRIEAARADGTPIKIKVMPITSNSTSVKIRVGRFGNRAMSEMISDEIKSRL